MGTSEDPLPSVRRIIQGSRGCGKCGVRNHDGLSAFQPDRRGSSEESRVSTLPGLERRMSNNAITQELVRELRWWLISRSME